MNNLFIIRTRKGYELWILALFVSIFIGISLGLTPSFFLPFLVITIVATVFALMFLLDFKTTLLLLFIVRSSLDMFNIQIGRGFFSGLNIAGLLSLLIIFGGILYIIGNGVKLVPASVSRPFIAFLFITFASVIFSPNITTSLQEWTRLISIFIVFLLVADIVKTKKQIIHLIGIFLFSVFMPLLLGYYQLFTGTGYSETAGFNRIMGTFVHPNPYAHYLLWMLIIAIVIFFETKFLALKIGIGILIFNMGISLFFTYTRGAWIGLIIALLILGILKYRKLLVFTLLLILVFLLFVPAVSQRFTDISNPNPSTGNSIVSRINFWKETFPLFLSNPVIGQGWGTAASLTEAPTHNDFIRVLAETGILGFIAYLWLLLSLACSSWRTYLVTSNRFYRSLVLAFFTLGVTYLLISIDTNLIRNTVLQWYFWTFAAIVLCAIPKIEREHKSESKPQPL